MCEFGGETENPHCSLHVICFLIGKNIVVCRKMFQFKVLSRHLFSFSFSSPYKKISSYHLCFDNLELTYKFQCVKLQYVLPIVGGEVYMYKHQIKRYKGKWQANHSNFYRWRFLPLTCRRKLSRWVFFPFISNFTPEKLNDFKFQDLVSFAKIAKVQRQQNVERAKKILINGL